MARYELGYLREVFGLEVDELTGSDFDPRYVLGKVAPESLPERPVRLTAGET